MNKLLIAALCFSSAISFGCAENKPSAGNAANSTATTANKTSAAPKTEAVDKDFVSSETGTEKAKPESGKANVQGKVLYNDKPAEGIEVKICEDFNRFVGGCDGESFKTKTDANGEYLFSNIKPGVYEGLLVKVFNTENYVFATKGLGISSAKYKFDADQTFFAPETNLFKDDLKIQTPKNESNIKSGDVEIKWNSYPDAAYYKLTVSSSENSDSSIYDQKIEGTNFIPTNALKSGKYSLSLSAFNAADKKLAETAEDIEFTVAAETLTDGAQGSSR